MCRASGGTSGFGSCGRAASRSSPPTSLDPPRARARAAPLRRQPRRRRLRALRGRRRPRRGPAHRSVVSRRGAQRRVPRLGAGGRRRSPHRRPRVPRARERVVRGELGGAARGRCAGPDGAVIGIQLENELYDQPGHLATLKRHGARGRARAPDVDGDRVGRRRTAGERGDAALRRLRRRLLGRRRRPWDPRSARTSSSRTRGTTPASAPTCAPTPARPRPAPRLHRVVPGRHLRARRRHGDRLPPPPSRRRGRRRGRARQDRQRLGLAGLLHVRAAARTRGRGLQESHATGYPNDLPALRLRLPRPDRRRRAGSRRATPSCAASTRSSRRSASALAPMPSTPARAASHGRRRRRTLRWALRSDGTSGFALHRLAPAARAARHGARRAVRGDARRRPTVLPHVPIDVPAGTIAHWPLHLELGGVHLTGRRRRRSRCSDGERPTLVLVAEAGIPVEVATAASVSSPRPMAPPGCSGRRRASVIVDAEQPVRLELERNGRLDVLVVPAASAGRAWVLDGGGRRRLVLAPTPSSRCRRQARGAGFAGAASRRSTARDRAVRGGRAGAVDATDERRAAMPRLRHGERALRARRPGRDAAASYGERARRASAPTRDEVVRYGTVVDARASADRRGRGTSRSSGRATWHSSRPTASWSPTASGTARPWTIGLDALGIADAAESTLRIVPLHPEASVHLPGPPPARRRSVEGPLLALDAVRLVEARSGGRRRSSSARSVTRHRSPGPDTALARLLDHREPSTD